MKEEEEIWDKKLSKYLQNMMHRHGQVFWDTFFASIRWGQEFGFCECGRPADDLNVGYTEYFYCKKCNTYWRYNGRVRGDLRGQTASVWEKHLKILQKARLIEPNYLHVSPGGDGQMFAGLMHEPELSKTIQAAAGPVVVREKREEPPHENHDDLPF